MHRYFHRLLLLLVALCSFGFGQVAYQLAPVAHQQFFDANGKPLAGGFVYTFAAGSSTPLATYKDNAGTANTNPIVLDAGGFATIYLGQNSYKFVVQNSSAVQQWSQDNVQNISQVLLTTANVWTAAQTFNALINFLGGTSDTTAADGNFFYRTDLHRGRWYDSGAAAWHSIVGADSTDTLTNKTLTSPTITTPTISNPTVTTGTFTSPALNSPVVGGGSILGKILTGTATLTFTAISAQTSQEQNFALTGATAGMGVFCSPQATLGNANLVWSAWVNGTNQIGVRVSNPTVGSITPAAVAWGCTSFQ